MPRYVDADDRREQRRYEIARDVMAGLIANPEPTCDLAADAKFAVHCADTLLKALKPVKVKEPQP
jgi:hypothetical protein